MKIQKNTKVTLMVLVVMIAGCANKTITSTPKNFFNNLQALCGQVFKGASTFPDDPGHDFAGKVLVADFISCNEKQINIKFAVGSDRSRTWVITKSKQGLLLKHDHRHEDGTPDEVTNYGGWANNQGSVWRQHFVADKETAELIPDARTNVWMLEFDPNNQVLTYDLKRHGLPRYQAQLKPQ